MGQVYKWVGRTELPCKVAILNAKAIQPLVRLLCEGDETGKERAAGVLQALSMLDDNGKDCTKHQSGMHMVALPQKRKNQVEDRMEHEVEPTMHELCRGQYCPPTWRIKWKIDWNMT